LELGELVARRLVLAAALVAALLPVSGAGGSTAQTPKRGGTLVVGTLREPPCLNAYLYRCSLNLPPAGILMSLPLRGAFSVGRDYTYRPDLVSRAEYTTRPPFTVTYHIRPKARWSDGRDVTAQDFVFTHAAIRSVMKELYAPEAEDWAVIRSVRAVDAKTVGVVLRAGFAGWQRLFPSVLPAHALRGQDLSTVWLDGIRNPRTGRPIGSGPFLVESWERGRAITFVRNPRYWRHPPYVARLVVRFCQQCGAPGAEQLELLRTGGLDLVLSTVLTGEQVGEIRSLRDVSVLAGQGPNWEHLEIRLGPGGHPALKRKLVRRALAYGMDRVALARTIYGEIDARYAPSDSAIYPVFSPHYRPNWRGYRYGPARARSLLEAEGCRREPDGIYACDGTRLSFRLATLAGDPRRQGIVENIQRQLRSAGVEIVPVYYPPPILFDQVLPSGNFDLALFSYLSFPDGPGRSHLLYGCGGGQNLAGYCQRLVDRDLEQARRIVDPRRQAEVLNRADAQLAKDVPVIPLFQIPVVIASKSSVRNVRLVAFLDPFVNAENWWLDR
jgi:peptide/nickel transport system substrate-binding protein